MAHATSAQAHIAGSFIESDCGNLFDYGQRPQDGMEQAVSTVDFPHAVWVSADDYRYAKVLKTVAYIAVDENADGTPVVEKWNITRHKAH